MLIKKGDTRINPETGQIEVLTPEGEWSSQRLEQQVGFIQSEVQRLSKEATILDTGRLREEVIPKIKTDLQNLEGQGGAQVSGQPEESITLYRGTSTAQVPKSYVGEWIGKGWGTQQPTAGGLSKDEQKALGVETPEDTQAKQLQTDILRIDSQIDSYNQSFDTLLTSFADQTNELVENIKRQYEIRRQQLKRINESQTGSYRTLSYRLGIRYSPSLGDIVSEVEKQGQLALAEIDESERAAIQQAKSAITQKQFDVAKENIEQAISLREKKQIQLNELNKEIRKRNADLTEQEDKNYAMQNVERLVESGITDPLEIYNLVNQTREILDYADIQKITDTLKKEESLWPEGAPTDYKTYILEGGQNTGQTYEEWRKAQEEKWQEKLLTPDQAITYGVLPGTTWGQVAEKGIVPARYKEDEPKVAEPLSILDVQRYNEIYPDAGIIAGDTETTAIQKVLQTITPRDFSDDELRSLINEVKTGNKTYDEALTAINSVAQIKNKDRAIAIANEIYGKKQGTTGQAFSETAQGLKIIAGETGQNIQEGTKAFFGQQIFDFLFKSQRNK